MINAIGNIIGGYGGMSTNDFPSCPSATYDLSAQDVINAMTTLGATVDDTRKGYINTLITGLKTDGNWEKLAMLQVYAGITSGSSLFNWTNRWVFFPTRHGTVTFAANKGFTGNGTTGYIDTHFNDGLSMLPLQNDSAMFVWNLTNNAETTTICGHGNGGTSSTLLQPKRADTLKAGALHNSASPANQTTANITDPRGLWVVKRTASGQFELWLNGVLLQTFAATSAARNLLRYFVLAQSNSGVAAGFSTRQVALFGVSTGAIDVPALYTRFNTYLTQIGTFL